MNGPAGIGRRSLDELAAEIFVRGWVFEIIVMGATYELAPIPRMTAQAYLGRIMTPNGEIEWSDVTPQAALAGAFTEAVENPGSAR